MRGASPVLVGTGMEIEQRDTIGQLYESRAVIGQSNVRFRPRDCRLKPVEGV